MKQYLLEDSIALVGLERSKLDFLVHVFEVDKFFLILDWNRMPLYDVYSELLGQLCSSRFLTISKHICWTSIVLGELAHV